jgi:hypothetical protein
MGDPAPEKGQVVLPLDFKQKLLICNAYPSSSPMQISKNSLEVLADDKNAIPYRECRYFASHVAANDRLTFKLRDFEADGSFVVGGLPTTDAILLLVLDKKGKSSMVNFQSYAFPTNAESKEAQLAVIDAFRGNASLPRLKMEDHIVGKEPSTVSKRVEELNFNQVYAIEEGVYDASVENRLQANENQDQVMSTVENALHTIKLNKKENYVILRTGDSEFGDGPGLVIFPQADFKSGAASFRSALSATCFRGMVAVAMAFWAGAQQL